MDPVGLSTLFIYPNPFRPGVLRRCGAAAAALLLLAAVVPVQAAATRTPVQETVYARQEVAYVSREAPGPGALDEAALPFPSLRRALEAGATELRIEPGVYDEGALVLAQGGTVTLRTWDGRAAGKALDAPGDVDVRGDVRIEGGTTLALAAHGATFRIHGDLVLADGVLDVADNTLELDAAQVFVGGRGAFYGSGQCTGSLIRYIGTDQTDVFFETTAGALVVTNPSIEVRKDPGGGVSFNLSGVPATNPAPNPPDRIDEFRVPCFTLTSGTVDLLDGLDLFHVETDYTQSDGDLSMAGVSSPGGVQDTPQTVSVDDLFAQEDGTFRTAGGNVEVSGDFLLGHFEQDGTGLPSDALFSLTPGGTQTVRGTFRAAPDTNPNVFDEDERNRYFLGGGNLILWGDYYFLGTGDGWDDSVTPPACQGLDGTVFFTGESLQAVGHLRNTKSQFRDVVMDGAGVQVMEAFAGNDSICLNAKGRLTLLRGRIEGHVALANPEFEVDLVERNNAAVGAGVVELGSRDSYVRGAAQRAVEFGNASGGLITGGYLFPVGAPGDPRSGGDVDFFRPLILQFPDDLGQTSLARVEYLNPDEVPDLDFDGLVVDDVDDRTLDLDVLGDLFWQLEFDRIPAFDPNVRVEAAGLPNIFDVKRLRIVQWDCDGANPRLFGVYDVDRDPSDDPSAVLNDFINGVPNLTQEGGQVTECQILGLASNGFFNRIDLAAFDQGLTPLQVINAAADEVDVYFTGRRLLDDLSTHSATPYGALPAGATPVDVTAGDATDNGSPLASGTADLGEDPAILLIAGTPGAEPFGVFARDHARRTAANAATVDVLFAHAAARQPDLAVSVAELGGANPVEAGTLSLGGFSDYHALDPLTYLINVSDPAGGGILGSFTLDLSARAGAALTLVIDDAEGGKAADLSLLAFDADGNPVALADVTAADAAAELPETFTLYGNYPNPFNPSTTIRFDLPENARVRVELIDVLGRTVMTLPARAVQAGAGRTLAVDASTLASGTYIYRVVAQTDARTTTRTGRMVLVK